MLSPAWGASREVPLPPARPTDPPAKSPLSKAGPLKPEPLGPPAPQAAPLASPVAQSDATAACDHLLDSGKVTAVKLPPVPGINGCGIEAPVSLSAIKLVDGSVVALAPAATIRCDFAERVADWVREDLAPLLAHGSSRFIGLANADSYDCRGRNRVVGAKLSEHGSGNAIDIRALTFADHSSAEITKVAASMAVFAQIKLTACTRFSTVLGPGSDGFHEDNLHLDAAFRRNGAHFCRWRLP